MQTTLISLSALILLFTTLPIIKNEYWVFRVFDYPRLQKFTATLLCIGLLTIFYEAKNWIYPTLLAAMILNALYLLRQIFPFTRFAKVQVNGVSKSFPDQSISLMVANVYQENRNYKGCLSEIERANPDVVLLLETDNLWDKNTSELSKKFAYEVKVPLENTYGMLLYSKLELKNASVNYLVENDIPSIQAEVILKNGQAIKLFAVHPTPPVPQENPRSTERDKELLLVADMAKATKLPVIVIGDLNDVAWSYTTELFLKMSGLLDPRRGRGFFNSFHAHYPFLRFPLDHAFTSTDMKLKNMRRLQNFDSDHFPIFISLQHEPAAKLEHEEMQPDAEDIKIAEEKKEAV
ncbi:MAG: endonuclease/exonuclease/phosphatase family protein [Flavobacterium sp.]|nr:MAG: endonuclease/exonuclease/phosphatase family protein [Flavobacterium sp.]